MGMKACAFYMLAESLPPLVLTRSLSLFRYIPTYI